MRGSHGHQHRRHRACCAGRSDSEPADGLCPFQAAKDHGRTNQIEGRCEPGTKVVVVEDLISTGGSCIDVVNVLREAGAEVLGIASIFTYGPEKGIERLAAANVKNVSASNYDALIEVAVETGYISADDVKKLQAFRANPSDSSWMSL